MVSESQARTRRPLPVEAPPLPGPAVLSQGWAGVVFLHWSVEPRQVAHLFPSGTRPDVFDGATYVGLVAFHATFTRALGVLPVGAFDEVNVRLYSVDEHGRRGVVFLSMDADSLHNVLAARALVRVPYVWSDTSLRQRGAGQCAGAVRRRWPQHGAWGRWNLRVQGQPVAPTPLEHFVTARWGLHTPHAGGTHWLRVSHEPWTLHRAQASFYEGDLLTRAGVLLPETPPVSVLWSPGVMAKFTPSLLPVR